MMALSAEATDLEFGLYGRGKRRLLSRVCREGEKEGRVCPQYGFLRVEGGGQVGDRPELGLL